MEMEFEFDRLRELIRFMDENGLVEVEIADSADHIRLRRPEIMQREVEIEEEEVKVNPSPPVPATPPVKPTEPEKNAEPEVIDFTATMVGTFRLKLPEGEPYVEVGKEVNPKAVLCVIEAMSVPNEIRAKVTGTVSEILAEDGQSVEFGTPLFRITVPPQKG